ncbi:hypothetical protein KFK09_007721 [Dendrobium nobile]|uniref:Uncharacterized protein n=1 Tax=Dendrobium nobile TaxID=94219 RepID=A0A8T3BUW1_DENNO|nr:hypothetical protein KFK09_007721 [Dendrobium nobile]
MFIHIQLWIPSLWLPNRMPGGWGLAKFQESKGSCFVGHNTSFQIYRRRSIKKRSLEEIRGAFMVGLGLISKEKVCIWRGLYEEIFAVVFYGDFGFLVATRNWG